MSGDNFITIPDTITVLENEIVRLPVTLTAPPSIGTTASLDYATNPVAGRAIEGTHYQRASGTLRWNPWIGSVVPMIMSGMCW